MPYSICPKILLKIICVFCLTCSALSAETLSSSEGHNNEIVEAYGFKYNLPPDYPIKKINGIVQPVPLSDYLYMKLSEINLRLDGLTKRLDALEGVKPEPVISEAPSLTRLFLSLEQSNDTETQ